MGDVIGIDGVSKGAIENAIDERERYKVAVQVTARLQRKVDEARAHPLGLLSLCFKDDRGEAVALSWFHKEWVDLFLSQRYVLIEASRGLTKTTTVIACILWILGHNPDIRIKLVCGNDANASKRLAEIKSNIESNPFYHLVFPEIKVDRTWKNDNLTLNLKRTRLGRDATIEAKGVLSDGTGDRADLIIFDDACNYKNSVQEASTRERVHEKIVSDWLNTLNPRDGRVWMLFTPWHLEDAHARLKKSTQGRWAYRRYAHGEPGNPYKSIFPQLFSSQYLQAKEQDIGSIEYAKAYLCLQLSADAQIVRHEWLRTYNEHDLTPFVLERCEAYLVIDPIGGKQTSRRSRDRDFMGVVVILVDKSPHPVIGRPKTQSRIYVVEAYRVRLSTKQAATHIVELARRWAVNDVIIEVQGAQTMHRWVYEVDPKVGITAMPASINKRLRLESVTPWIESHEHMILFNPDIIKPTPKSFAITVGGDEPTTAKARRTLRGELLGFPTTHDDVMDAFVRSLEYARMYVLPLDTGDDDDDNDDDDDDGEDDYNMDVKVTVLR